jgi:hypothetical protein
MRESTSTGPRPDDGEHAVGSVTQMTLPDTVEAS